MQSLGEFSESSDGAGLTSGLEATDPQLQQARLARLQAETYRLDAEQHKLLLEAQELRLPWFKRPAYVQAIVSAVFSPLLLLATLFIGYLTNQASSERIKLEADRTRITTEMQRVEADRERLGHEVQTLANQATTLKTQNGTLGDREKQLQGKIESMQSNLAGLQHAAALGNVRTYVDRLKSAGEMGSPAIEFTRFLELLVNEIQDERAKSRRDERVALVKSEASSTANRPISRAYLQIALGRVTGDARMADKALAVAQKGWDTSSDVWLPLLSLYEFDSVDRGHFLCSIHPLNISPKVLMEFDRRAILMCSAPYFENVLRSRNDARVSQTEDKYSELATLSPQAAFCVWASSGAKSNVRNVIASRLRTAPAPVRAIVDASNPASSASVWFAANRGACDPWLEPNLDTLRDATLDDLTKILHGEWIIESGIHRRSLIMQ
jgi:hypothetical protein